MRLEPPAPLVDWSIFALVCFELGSGAVSFLVGRPSGGWVVVLHGVAGFTLVALLGFKFRRVWGRVADADRWDRTTPVSIALAGVVVAALATGLYWVHGSLVWVGFWTLLSVHVLFGLLAVPLVVVHLKARWRLPAREDLQGRRSALQYGTMLVGGAAVWRLQRAANGALSLPGRARRFTGSKESGSDDGNDFPVTSWVADDPDPVDASEWSLSVVGAVDRERAYDYADLGTADGGGSTADGDAGSAGSRAPADEERALLDCTSGWYSEHDWRGVRVGDLLDSAGTADGAAWVSFRSVTGYRWSLPIDEARDALLATHVDGDRLAHGHGYPLRLVAPGRRGFQWVKWVEEVRVQYRRDRSEWLAVFVSGFD